MKTDEWIKLLSDLSPKPDTTSLASLCGFPAPPPKVPTLGSGLRSALRDARPALSRIPGIGLDSIDNLAACLSTPAPSAVPAATGLQFQGRYFSEPTALDGCWLPMYSGVYGIVVIDGTWGPRPYKAIYFGKAENLSSRVSASHEKYYDWCRAAGGCGSLYVTYHSMPESADWQRAAFEESLIRHYNPMCNETFNRLKPFGHGPQR